MSSDAYFEGPSHNFFIKPVIFGDSAGGEPSRWSVPEDGEPDAWTVHAMLHATPHSSLFRLDLSDHFSEAEAVAEAERHCKQDQMAHLLGAQYDPVEGRIHMP